MLKQQYNRSYDSLSGLFFNLLTFLASNNTSDVKCGKKQALN